MDSMTTAPLLTALEALHESHTGGMHTAMPGIVQSYDAETQLATVLPAVNFKIPRGPTLPLSPIDNVPVMFPFTAGFRMSFPIAEGDGVLLIFSEASLGNWIEGSGQVDPEDSSRFSMHDAIAIPGLWQPNMIPSLAADEDFLLVSKTGARIGGTSDGKLDFANDVSDMRTKLEEMYAQLVTLRQDLGQQCQAIAAAISSDVSFCINTASAVASASATHIAAVTELSELKTSLQELLK